MGTGGGTSGGTTYKVTVEPPENGTVTATPSAGVAEGTEVTLEIKPETGYALGKLTVDGADKTADVAAGKYTFTMPAGNVTVSATFKATGPFGSKASPDAKGDIVFKDGSAEPYSADLTLTDEQKAAAVAVIFDATKKLGVGLVQGQGKKWAKNGTAGHTKKITGLVCTPTGDNASTATFSTGATDGSTSLGTFKDFVENNGNDYSEGNYPAWYWIENYAATANLTGTSYESEWYMPSIKELCDLYKVKDAVNNSIEKTGGTQMFTNNWYWSSSHFASNSDDAWNVDFGSGDLLNLTKNSMYSVCAFRAF